MKMCRTMFAMLSIAAGAALAPLDAGASPDWWSWDDGYARSFKAEDIDLEYHGDWYYVPILLVPNGGDGGALLTRGDSDWWYEIPRCPFVRDGFEFTGWKMFDACLYSTAWSGTATSCVLPSGETYSWEYDGYAGERLPGEWIEDVCGRMVFVAQWREVQSAPKYRLSVSVDPEYKGGSVSGSGDYAPGAVATLKATPKKGYFFSEWEVAGTTDAAADKYEVIKWETGARQKPTLKIKMPAGATKIIARFVKGSKDYIVFDGQPYPWYPVANGDEKWICIQAETLIKSVTASGVPKGVSFRKYDYGNYILKTTKISQLAPGKTYKVKVTVKTASGKSKSIAIPIHGPNRKTAVDKGVLELDTYYNGYDGGYRLRAGTKFSWEDLGIYAADGWKITKVAGLPAGLKWNVAKQKMTGVPSKKGTYTVTFTVTKGKTSYTASATFKVSALPSAATGTFTGFATWTYDWREDDGLSDSSSGPIYDGFENARLDSSSKNAKITVSPTGKISAKVGSVSFSGTGLTYVSDGVYRASLKRSQKITSGASKGCTQSWQCDFEIDATAAWDSIQLRGVFWPLGNNCAPSMGGPGFLTAQRYPFGKNSKKKYVNAAAGKIAARLSSYGTMKTACLYVGTGVYDLAGPACIAYSSGYRFPLAFKVDAAGKVTVAGKVGSLAVSGATILKVAPSTWAGSSTPDGENAYQADFCLTAAKKAVRIHIEFSPDNGVCRHGWVTVGNHSWEEYYGDDDYDDNDDW